MKHGLLILVAGMTAVLLAGCSFKGISNDTNNETNILVVAQTGGIFKPMAPAGGVDVNGDGVLETAFTKQDLKILSDMGWEIQYYAEDHVGTFPAE